MTVTVKAVDLSAHDLGTLFRVNIIRPGMVATYEGALTGLSFSAITIQSDNGVVRAAVDEVDVTVRDHSLTLGPDQILYLANEEES